MVTCLWDSIAPQGAALGGEFLSRSASVKLAELSDASIFGTALESLRGRNVLIATREQLPTALALIELDGVAHRMVLCTPDLSAEQLAGVAATAEADAIVLDSPPDAATPAALIPYLLAPRPLPAALTIRWRAWAERCRRRHRAPE
jgi:hypothetical protein